MAASVPHIAETDFHPSFPWPINIVPKLTLHEETRIEVLWDPPVLRSIAFVACFMVIVLPTVGALPRGAEACYFIRKDKGFEPT